MPLLFMRDTVIHTLDTDLHAANKQTPFSSTIKFTLNALAEMKGLVGIHVSFYACRDVSMHFVIHWIRHVVSARAESRINNAACHFSV